MKPTRWGCADGSRERAVLRAGPLIPSIDFHASPFARRRGKRGQSTAVREMRDLGRAGKPGLLAIRGERRKRKGVCRTPFGTPARSDESTEAGRPTARTTAPVPGAGPLSTTRLFFGGNPGRRGMRQAGPGTGLTPTRPAVGPAALPRLVAEAVAQRVNFSGEALRTSQEEGARKRGIVAWQAAVGAVVGGGRGRRPGGDRRVGPGSGGDRPPGSRNLILADERCGRGQSAAG